MASIATEPKAILLISMQNNLSIFGLKYLHYLLLDKGHTSHLLYIPYFKLDDRRALKNIKNFVLQIKPSFMGLSLMSTEYKCSCNISVYLRAHFPTIPIIWGGVHPTIAPETCFPFADYLCIGEGERTILDLADSFKSGRDIKEIPNLYYQDGGLLKKNRLYPLIDNLDELPCLDNVPLNSFIQKSNGQILPIDERILKKEARYQGKMYEVVTSRGCAFSCTYCCNNFFSNLYETRRIRRRSVENIIFELERAIKNNPNIAMIHFQDDSFMACGKEYLAKFCKYYSEKIKKPFLVHSVPIHLNLEAIASLKKAGLVWLNFGLQSGSDRVCKDIYKRNSFKKDFLRAAELIKRFKIAGKYDVILDNPFENEEETFETIETLMETPRPSLIEFYSLTFYPGTELYEKARAKYPDMIGDFCEKNYMQYKCTTLNKMVMLAVCIPPAFMRKILQLYKVKPQSLVFKITLFITMILFRIYYKPINHIRVFKLSHEDSYIKALWNFPMYLKEILTKNY